MNEDDREAPPGLTDGHAAQLAQVYYPCAPAACPDQRFFQSMPDNEARANSKAWVPSREWPWAARATYNWCAKANPGKASPMRLASFRAMPMSLMKCST